MLCRMEVFDITSKPRSPRDEETLHNDIVLNLERHRSIGLTAWAIGAYATVVAY